MHVAAFECQLPVTNCRRVQSGSMLCSDKIQLYLSPSTLDAYHPLKGQDSDLYSTYPSPRVLTHASAPKQICHRACSCVARSISGQLTLFWSAFEKGLIRNRKWYAYSGIASLNGYLIDHSEQTGKKDQSS